MAKITTEVRIKRRMLYFGVSRSTALDMLTAEDGGDMVVFEHGKRIRPDWWHKGRAERASMVAILHRAPAQRRAASNA